MKQVTLAELKQYLSVIDQPRRIDEVILHHTWRPTAAQYQRAGVEEWSTWGGIKRYHMETRGWSDIGYHIGVGPDDSIWLLRPIERSGAHCLDHNTHSIGVVLLGNFDEEDPVANGLRTVVSVLAAVCERYDLPTGAIFFHRDFASKSCPGSAIGKYSVRAAVLDTIAEPELAAGTDVSPWAQEPVDWCQENKIMEGFPDGTFRGQEPVTREQQAVTLYRYKKYLWNLFYQS